MDELDNIETIKKEDIFSDYNPKSENENLRIIRISNLPNINSEIHNPIIEQLIEFGYDPTISKRLVYLLHPPNIDQAIDYLLEENGIIQHYFYENRIFIDKCYICEKGREQHLVRRNNNFQSINNNLNNSNSESYMSQSIRIKDYSICDEIEMKKQICIICDDEYMQSNYTTNEKCSHSFCKSCWLNYLSVNINDKKLTKIKCMNSSCEEILSDYFIYTLINSESNEKNELLLQFNENKLRQEILNNPRKKFCPFPNCNSYARRNNKKEKFVKCENGHSFCFYCLKEPHEGKECLREMDEKMEEFAKKKFIKKCPKCQIWTEKISGCNHIICVECGFQWCWLCNKKYNDVSHYKEGKCKGFQFFNPKNENDIQLAFEGKIKLRDDERMPDFIYDDFNNAIPRPEFNNDQDILLTFGLMEKIGMFFLFLFFGTILTIICESGFYIKFLLNHTINNTFYLFFFLITIFCGFSIFIFQIYLNIIIFIMTIINSSAILFFNTFYNMLMKIKRLSVMKDYDKIIIVPNIYKLLAIFVSLSFGSFFWIINFINHKRYDDFIFKKSNFINSIYTYIYTFTLFLLILCYYPYFIILNIFGFFEEIISKGVDQLFNHIKDSIEIVFNRFW